MKLFSIDELELITEYAYDTLSWKDIAYLLKIPVGEFKMIFDNPRSSVHLAYQKGRVKRKHELRKPILSMASKGSPQAEMLAVRFLDEQFLDETDD